MGQKVPDYLKTLVESGLNPEDAFKLAEKAENDQKKSKISPDMKLVKQTLKKISENQRNINKNSNHKNAK